MDLNAIPHSLHSGPLTLLVHQVLVNGAVIYQGLSHLIHMTAHIGNYHMKFCFSVLKTELWASTLNYISRLFFFLFWDRVSWVTELPMLSSNLWPCSSHPHSWDCRHGLRWFNYFTAEDENVAFETGKQSSQLFLRRLIFKCLQHVTYGSRVENASHAPKVTVWGTLMTKRSLRCLWEIQT